METSSNEEASTVSCPSHTRLQTPWLGLFIGKAQDKPARWLTSGGFWKELSLYGDAFLLYVDLPSLVQLPPKKLGYCNNTILPWFRNKVLYHETVVTDRRPDMSLILLTFGYIRKPSSLCCSLIKGLVKSGLQKGQMLGAGFAGVAGSLATGGPKPQLRNWRVLDIRNIFKYFLSYTMCSVLIGGHRLLFWNC